MICLSLPDLLHLIYTTMFKINNQQGPTVQHRELCLIFWEYYINGKRFFKKIDTCLCITESLCCTPETNTTSLINCAPIKINFFKKRL